MKKLICLRADNWQYTFKNLPLEAGNKAIQYRVLELGTDYDVMYENNDFSTDTLSHSQVVNVKITNDKKPEITETTEPSETEPTEFRPKQPSRLPSLR